MISRLLVLVVIVGVIGFFLPFQSASAATTRTGETVAADTVYKGETNVEAVKFYLTVDADTTIAGVAPTGGTVVTATEDSDWNTGGATTNFYYYDKTESGAWDAVNDWMGFDLDADGVYTNAADSIIDSDGTAGTGPGNSADTKAAGDALTNFDGSDNVFVTGGNSTYTSGEGIWLDKDSDNVVTTAADTVIDCDGTVTAGPGTCSLSAGESLLAVETADNICTDNAANPTIVFKDNNGACVFNAASDALMLGAPTEDTDYGDPINGQGWAFKDGGNTSFDAEEFLYLENYAGELTYSAEADSAILETLFAAGTAGVELDGASNLVYNDEAADGLWASGEDIITESYAGEKTWSTTADTTVGGTAPAAGTAILDAKDADWTTVKFYDKTGAGAWDAGNDWIGIDSDNYYLDQLNAITAQLNSGSTAATSDIAAVKFWLDADNDGVFESGSDTALGTGVWDTGIQGWYLSSLTQALVSGTANRIFVSVDIAANPTNGATIKMEIPTQTGTAPYDINDGDRGIYLASIIRGGVTNANYMTIDALAPTVTSIVVSNPIIHKADDGNSLTIDVNFSETMDTGTAPVITFDQNILGGGTLTFVGGSSSWTDSDTYRATYTMHDIGENQTTVNVVINSAKDLVGNTMTQDTQVNQINVDTSAPTANFGAATDNVGSVTGALVSGDTTDDTALALSGTNETGSTVEVFDGAVSLGAATVVGGAWSYSATVANGTTYQFNVKETDLAGNTSDATSNFTVIGDTSAPTFTMQYYSDNGLTEEIAGGTDLKAGTYYIKITSDEALGSAPTVSIAAEGTANDVTDGATTLVAGNNYKYTRTISADAAAVGTVIEEISVTGTDLAGNTSTDADPTNEAAKEIYTDTVAPIVNAGSDAGDAGEQFTQVGSATDPAGSGIASYAWTKFSGPYTVTFGTATASTTTVSAAGAGYYTIRLTVTDTAGNSAYDDATFTWGAINVPIVAYSPANGSTDVAIANGTSTITFGGSLNISLLNASKVTLVNNDGTETSVKGTVAVADGNGNSKVLNIPYSGLENSHTYRINILSGAVQDSSGHINSDGVSYFTTVAAAGDTIPPVISGVSSTTAQTTASVNFQSNENGQGRLAYSTGGNTPITTDWITLTADATSTINIASLVCATTYDYSIYAKDGSNNNATASTGTFTTAACTPADTTAPEITDIALSRNQTTATILFTSDEAGTAKVGYGLTASHGNMTSYKAMIIGSTTISLSGLTCGTTYHYTVYGKDASGNEDNTADDTFDTLACAEPTEISVTKTSLVKRIATKNGEFADGWRWVLDVTVPTASSSLAMSFDDLTGAGTIVAANHIRFYSAQSSDHAAAVDAIVIGAAGAGTAWSDAIILNADLEAATPGRQIQITIQAAVPSGTVDGAYSASYDIQAGSPI